MIEIISATRLSEKDFWNRSALGISLDRLSQDRRLFPHITFNNQRGLPDVFNARITAADGHDILVFVHDDVWIDDYFFADRVVAGLNTFDVIGIAGNRRRLQNQPSWAFIDTNLTWDSLQNLSGSVAHGVRPFGPITVYGDVPAECELLDGVFLAVRKSGLVAAKVQFDPQFDFHFYDMDFCRSARESGLRLGTWPICMTHQSIGAFKSPQWREKYQLYRQKWISESAQQSASATIDQALQQAIMHHQADQLPEAEELYRAILQVQPNHPDANYHLGMLALQVHQPEEALPYLNVALQADPGRDQCWLKYLEALILTGNADAAQQLLELGREHGLQEELLGAMTARLGAATKATAPSPLRLEPNIAEADALGQIADTVTRSELASHSWERLDLSSPPKKQTVGTSAIKVKKKPQKKPNRLRT